MSQRLVRLTYWVGAVIDLLAGIQLLIPEHVALLGHAHPAPAHPDGPYDAVHDLVCAHEPMSLKWHRILAACRSSQREGLTQ